MSEQRVLLPGQRLRAEREARGMTELQAARELNLTVSYLRALEADDYERLPEPTFVKGYIRNYARLLELPSEDLASTFEEVLDEENAAEEEAHQQDVVRPRRRRSGVLMLTAGLVVVLAALVYWLMAGGDKPEEQTDTAAPAPSVQDAPADDVEDTNTESPEAGLGEGDEASAGEPAPDQAGPTEQETSVEEAFTADRLTMSFSDSCWIQVSNADGEVIFSGQRQPEERLRLEGKAPFDLRIGNAAAVALVTVNGETIEMPSSAPGDVVRLTVP